MKWITTTELGKRLGVYLSCKQIRTLTGMSGEGPAAGKGGGTVWHEGQIPNIARALCEHFSEVAGDKPLNVRQLPLKVNAPLPLPRLAKAKDLGIGTRYELGDGKVGIWDGQRMLVAPEAQPPGPSLSYLLGKVDPRTSQPFSPRVVAAAESNPLSARLYRP